MATCMRSDKSLTLTQSEEEQRTLRNLTVQQNLQIMRSRIEELGITEASIQRQGESRIRIELPGVQDPAAAKDVIGATASLAFYSVYDNADAQHSNSERYRRQPCGSRPQGCVEWRTHY